MATLYLHIGTCKTGTTAIQHFCMVNQEALKRRGYCFPDFRCDIFGTGEMRNGYFLTTRKNNPDGTKILPWENALWAEKMDAITREMKRYPRVILSDEVIWYLTKSICPELWKRLKWEAEARGFDVKIIVYLRRQDDLVNSMYAQRIRSHDKEISSLKLSEFLAQADDFYVLDYYRHYQEITSYFGKDNVIVRIYDRKRFRDGSVVSDFLEALGLTPDADFESVEGRDWNPSLGGNALEILRILNTLPDFNGELRQIARRTAFACYETERKEASFSMFSREELDALLARYAESNRLLARECFPEAGEDFQLFSEPEPLPPKWEPDNPLMHEAIIRFFGAMLVEQQKQLDKAKLGRRMIKRIKDKLRPLKHGLEEWLGLR